jgi:V-type H+-transporting ATPase subunit a
MGKVPQVISIFSGITSNPTLDGKLPVIGYNPGQIGMPAEGTEQYYLQLGILGVAFISVLVILFPKPFIVSRQQHSARAAWENKTGKNTLIEDSDGELGEKLIVAEKEEEDYNAPKVPEPVGELLIIQLIHTIEFVLGGISNTASYLRLWALSLAHSQLAGTFLDLIMMPFIKGPTNMFISTPIIFVAGTFFLLVTFAVLMIMDCAECGLHTLRLHWYSFS